MTAREDPVPSDGCPGDCPQRVEIDQRRVMCGDRVIADQWSGVVVSQHGQFSWVVIDGIGVPQTHATATLNPVDNSGAK